MKKVLSLFFGICCSLLVFGQCTVDQQYASYGFGIYPHTASTCGSFTFVGVEELQIISGMQSYTDSFKIVSVSGLPAGLMLTTDVMASAGPDAPYGVWGNTGTIPNQTPVLGCLSVSGSSSTLASLVANSPYNLNMIIDARVGQGSFQGASFSDVWYSEFGFEEDIEWSVTLTVGNDLGITLITQGPSCTGLSDGSVEVTDLAGGTPPYTYSWSTNDTESAIENVSTGSYNVVVVDANSCVGTASAQVPAGGANVMLEPFTGICTATTPFILSQGTPVGGIYTINGNSTTVLNPQELGQGMHTVLYTYTENNCTVSASQQVQISDAPAVTILGEVDPNPQSLNDYAIANVPGYTVTWAVTGDGQIINGQGSNAIEVFWGTAAAGEVLVTLTNLSCEFTVILYVGGGTGVNNDGETLALSLFPNPTSSIITLQTETPLSQAWLTDLTGRRLMPLQPNGTQWQADLSSLPSGMYLIDVLTQEGRRGVSKVVRE